MRKRHTRLFLWLAALTVSVCMILVMAPAVYADTDGTELQVTDQSEKLVIQLGPAWAGVEFELKTDVGVYPQPIIVSTEGVLSMELGGSKAYTLSALQSSEPVPAPVDATAEPGAENSEPDQAADLEGNMQAESTDEPAQTDAPDDAEPPSDTESENNLIKGIPNLHLFMFTGGLIAGVAGLVIMWILKKRRNRQYDDDDDYYDEE